MKKNVVYLLGAGFSAPLGIPVMSTFITKARSLRRGNPDFQYFDDVIALVQATVSASPFFQHDSNNIEEALSLLEMKDILDGGQTNAQLIQFIVDVIKHSTPEIPVLDINKMAAKRWSELFTRDLLWPGYCSFVAGISGLRFRETTREARRISVEKIAGDVAYSVLSLNYDLVLENVCQFLGATYRWGDHPRIHLPRNTSDDQDHMWPVLAKIHGSIDTGDIIPPTFNKGLYGSELPQSWRQAYQILLRANEIRVIGYSLPLTDSYIKYLLMASVDKLRDLDRIDWIVTDSNKVMTARLQDFISFDSKFIARSNVSSYLNALFNQATHLPQSSGMDYASFDTIEQAHDEFMRTYGEKIPKKGLRSA